MALPLSLLVKFHPPSKVEDEILKSNASTTLARETLTDNADSNMSDSGSEKGEEEGGSSFYSNLARDMNNGTFDFAAHGLPAPSRMPSAAEALKESRERSTEVINRWNELSQILDRHEATIRSAGSRRRKRNGQPSFLMHGRICLLAIG